MAINVAVLVGSLRQGSFSRAMAWALRDVAAPRLKMDIVEIGGLPLYNPDLDDDTPPDSWVNFRRAVARNGAVLFVTPEYNRSVPGNLKNAIDVGSRPYGKSVWAGKPAGVVSVSPGLIGAFGANHHLRQSLVFLDMPVMQQPEAYISKVSDLLDSNGKLTAEPTQKFLATFAEKFAAWAELHIQSPAEMASTS